MEILFFSAFILLIPIFFILKKQGGRMQNYRFLINKGGRMRDLSLASQVRQAMVIRTKFPSRGNQISIDLKFAKTPTSNIALVPFSFSNLDSSPAFFAGSAFKLYYRADGSKLIISKNKISETSIEAFKSGVDFIILKFVVIEYE